MDIHLVTFTPLLLWYCEENTFLLQAGDKKTRQVDPLTSVWYTVCSSYYFQCYHFLYLKLKCRYSRFFLIQFNSLSNLTDYQMVCMVWCSCLNFGMIPYFSLYCSINRSCFKHQCMSGEPSAGLWTGCKNLKKL